MNFKLEDVYNEIDKRAQDLWLLDREFELSEADHVWPKSTSAYQCRCPKHRVASGGLFWACYDRIMEAKRGVEPKSSRELSERMEKIRKESQKKRGGVA